MPYLVYALPEPSNKPFNFCTVPEELTTLQAGTQTVSGKIRISGRIRTLYSHCDFRSKNFLFGLLFLKHKLHLILPMAMQKSQSYVNFKGDKIGFEKLMQIFVTDSF